MYLKKVLLNISLSNEDFYKFIFKIKEIDVDEKFTRRVLTGRLNPPVLVDIICSQKFTEEGLKPDPNMFFHMYVDTADIQTLEQSTY